MASLYLHHPSSSALMETPRAVSRFICSKGSKSSAMVNLDYASSSPLLETPRAVRHRSTCAKGSKSCAKVKLSSSSALMKSRGGVSIDSKSGSPEVMDHHPCSSALMGTPGAVSIDSKSGSQSGSLEVIDCYPSSFSLMETPGTMNIDSKSCSTEMRVETLGAVSIDSKSGSPTVALRIGSTKVRDWKRMTDADFKREAADILAKSCDDISSQLPDNEWDDFCWQRGNLIQKSFERLARLYKNVDLTERHHILRGNYNTSSKVEEDIHPVDARKKNLAVARKEKKSNIQNIEKICMCNV